MGVGITIDPAYPFTLQATPVVWNYLMYDQTNYFNDSGNFVLAAGALSFGLTVSTSGFKPPLILSESPLAFSYTVQAATLTYNTGVHAVWQTLPVGGGGWVRGLIVAADGTMVGRTDTAGAYLYNSGTGSWSQLINPTSMPSAWIASNIESALSGCYELAIAPSNTQIFYMVF